MHYCARCDKQFSNPTCPRCGAKPQVNPIVSEPPTTMEVDEEMVVKATRPSLANLVRQGLKKGLIQVMPDYAQFRKK